MATIQRGNTISTLEPGESLALGAAILDEIDRLDRKSDVDRKLAQAKHFHEFGDNRNCDLCGMTEREYLLARYDQTQTICPLAKPEWL